MTDKMIDISAAQGLLIVKEAAKWKGTPYQYKGSNSMIGIGGCCSGTTYKIYCAAGFPYSYVIAANFRDYAKKTGLFRELGGKEALQDGDVLSWPHHLAISCTFNGDAENANTARKTPSGAAWTQINDMWSATKPNGPAYGPNKLSYWPSDRKAFRYQTQVKA